MATPSVAVVARLLLNQMKKDKAQYDQILKDIQKKSEAMSKGVVNSTKNVTKSMDELIRKSAELSKRLNQTTVKGMQQSIQITQELRLAFEGLAKGSQINIDRFNELIASGRSVNEAFGLATVSADELKRSKEELAEAAKREKEAIKEAKDAERSRVADIAKTVAAYTAWAAAIRLVIKAFLDAVDSYDELGREVRRVALELGISTREASGWVDAAERAGVSSATFNRAMVQLSRNIVNYHTAQQRGEEQTSNFAKAIRAFNIDLVNQNGELKSAAEVFIELQQKAREYGPGVATLAELSNALGFSTRQLVELLFDESLALDDVEARALLLGKTLGELDKDFTKELASSTSDLDAAWQGMSNTITRIFGPGLAELKRGFADLINSARAVIAIGTAMQNTIVALANGTIKWADANAYFLEQQTIFLTGTTAVLEKEAELKRQRDELAQQALVVAASEEGITRALEEQLRVREDLGDALEDYLDRVEDINRRFDDQLADADIRRGREQSTRSLRLSAALEDIHIKRAQRLRDITVDLSNRQRTLQRDLNRKLEDFEKSAARAREKIAVKHRENLIKIENRFIDTVQEAARTNDTVAVVRAIRRRNREQRDETRRFSVAQSELEKDLAIRRDRIRDDARVREEEERQRADERRARIEQQFKDEVDALNRKNQRELVLSRKKDEERRQDIERNRARALRDAQIHYNREKVDLQVHLRELRIIVGEGIQNTAIAAAKHAENGISLIATAAANAIAAASQDFIGGGFNNPAISDFYEEWLRRPKKNPRAHGGLDIVNRPTTFTAGEAGAEIAAFIPLSQNRNINHSFGKLPIDFNGLPGGMDTSQVEAIVTGAMIELARTLSASRR